MSERPAPEARIDTGRVRGLWRGECAVFLGIPYAQAPVGPLRFAAPAPARAWDGVREATTQGATSQRGDTGVTIIPEPSVPGEETLNVNVFTPSPGPAARLPVLVYIHGGGYISGSPASPWYDGAAFARDGVVTVVISYRVGVEGFGWLPDAASNRGVRDWLCALEWVQRNIAAFGGDPDRVTVSGQSAGGGAVLTLLGMPAARGLFRAAWSMSPTGVTIAAAAARAASEALAAKARIGRPTAEALADIPSERLRALVPNPPGGGLRALGRDLDGGIPNIGPTVDGDLIERPTLESLAAGSGSDTPLVVGGMDDEMSAVVDELPRLVTLTPLRLVLDVLGLRGERRRAYLAANPAVAARGHGAIIGRFVTDVTLRRDVMRVAQARAEAAAPTWVYAFSWVSPVTHWAMHCLDVPFFFDVLGAEGVARVAGSTPPAPLARQYHGAAVSLAHDHHVDWTAWAPGGVSRVFDGSDGLVESRDAYAGVMPLLEEHPDRVRAPAGE